MLKKAKKSRRGAAAAASATSNSPQSVRAVHSEGSNSSYSHQTPHLGIETSQMSHGKSTPEELHHAAEDEEPDAFL